MKKTSLLFGAAAMMLALTFNSCSKVDNGDGTTYVPYKIVADYDFSSEQALIAAGTVEKPGNLNGSKANGQAFFAWEKADKIDSERQDYRGYMVKEGSQLPEVCHVWRRSDRFDQDASWQNAGGLTCPNNREMVIDGLKVGDVIEIFYDASAAAEDAKEIIWAIGVPEGGPRATAIINGVEAVSGVTPIPSGAKIEVKSLTPAANVKDETGYIAFQVKKSMIISNIVISEKE